MQQYLPFLVSLCKFSNVTEPDLGYFWWDLLTQCSFTQCLTYTMFITTLLKFYVYWEPSNKVGHKSTVNCTMVMSLKLFFLTHNALAAHCSLSLHSITVTAILLMHSLQRQKAESNKHEYVLYFYLYKYSN